MSGSVAERAVEVAAAELDAKDREIHGLRKANEKLQALNVSLGLQASLAQQASALQAGAMEENAKVYTALLREYDRRFKKVEDGVNRCSNELQGMADLSNRLDVVESQVADTVRRAEFDVLAASFKTLKGESE